MNNLSRQYWAFNAQVLIRGHYKEFMGGYQASAGVPYVLPNRV